MTYDELDALPVTGGFGAREEIRDGRKVMVPVMERAFALYQGPDDIMVIRDRQGVAWSTGWHEGVLYKRRMGGL